MVITSFYKYFIGFLLILFIALLSYNFYIGNQIKYQTDGDALEFIELGVSLTKNQQFSFLDWPDEDMMLSFKKDNISNTTLAFAGNNTRRAPIWPLLIHLVFFLCGYNLIFLLVFKVVLHIFGVYLFFKTLKLLELNSFLIIAGTALYAFNPASQLYMRVFLSEPITFFFITFWLYFFVRFYKKKSGFLPQAVIAGIIVLSHPYYIFFPVSTYIFLLIFRQISFKTFLLSSLTCIAVVFTWIIRNFVVLETENIVLTTSSGAALAIGWNEGIISNHTNTQGDLADKDLVLKDYPHEKSDVTDEVQRMQLYKNATLNFIKTNPELIIPIIWKKLKSAFNPFPETRKSGFLEIGRATMHLLSLLSMIFILICVKDKFFKALVLGLFFSTILITVITYSGFRFRMPQIALEMLLIMVCVNTICQKKCDNKNIFSFSRYPN